MNFIAKSLGTCALMTLGLFAKEPGNITQVAKLDKANYELKTSTDIQFQVVFYKDDIFRIQAAPKGIYKDPKNDPKKAQILVGDLAARAKVDVKETADSITFKTAKTTLVINKKTATFEAFDAAGKSIVKELAPIDFTAQKTVQTLSSGIEEFYYGGGQQNGYFSHKGTKISVKPDGNWDEGGHPNPAPFYMSNAGYGVLRHTFAPGSYDFTSNQSIKLEHAENRFDAFYFIGDTFNKVVDSYTEYTGRPNFVPIWALELGEADAYMTRDKKTKQLSKDPVTDEFIETTPDVIERLAKKYREEDFPGGWILPNDGYGCGYVELPRVVKELKELGFYTGLWTEGDLVKTKFEVGTAGTRVQKLDVAWTWPAYQFALECNKTAWTSLETNAESRGFVWTVQGWAGTQRYGVCWTGDQYGTWDLIRYHIPTLTGSGLSGQAYATTDVDGIFGGSSETYTRDLQWKCFTPVMYVMNGWAGKMNKSPWSFPEPYKSINRDYLKLKMRMTPYMYKYCKDAYDTGAPITRPMLWDNPNDKHTWGTETQYQYMLGEHMLIAPVYTSMKVNKGFRKEDIYLPEGKWFDYNDGRTIAGKTILDTYPITLEKLPIFIKGGAIIPMYPEMLYNEQKPKDPLTLDIYPHGDSSFELYEDDGKTRNHKKGEFAKQLFEVSAPTEKAGNITVKIGKLNGEFTGKLEDRVYQFTVHTLVKPENITVEGVELPQNFFLSLFGSSNEIDEVDSKEEFEEATAAWYFAADEKRGTVHVKLPRVSTSQELTLALDIATQDFPASPAYPQPIITPELDKTQFVITTNSEQGGGGAVTNAFDGTDETMWHSNYGKGAIQHPYHIDVDLGGLYAVNGVNYLPRKGLGNGAIKDYEIYVSRVKGAWGKPVHKGTFPKKDAWQKLTFPTTWGKYVRIVAVNALNGDKHGSAAEFDILQDLKAAPLADEISYISDIKPSAKKGQFKLDKSFGGQSIKVNDTEYKKGIGALSGSEIIYTLDGSWDRFSGHVAIDDEIAQGSGSVMFRVFADGKLLFESPEMKSGQIKQLMDLKINGVKELKLQLLDLGDGSKNDHGDWVDAKLVRKGSE